MIIHVFVENEAGSNEKNCFNEQTLEFIKTVTVSRPYPFPYGFLPHRRSGDGDNLDCFIITKKVLRSREEVKIEAIGMMEQLEDGESDPKILAVFPDEGIVITEEVKSQITEFLTHVFDHLPNKKVQVGNFYGKEDAETLINVSKK